MDNLRIRVRYSRKGKAVSMSHLEHIRILREAVLMSGLPAAKTKSGGFERPRISFGPALPMNFESESEYADFYFDGMTDPRDTEKIFSFPETDGMDFISARRIPCGFPSVEALADYAEYSLLFSLPEEEREIFAGRSSDYKRIVMEKEKNGKILKASLGDFLERVEVEEGEARLLARYKTGSGFKAEDFIRALFPPGAVFGRKTRKNLFWMDSKGKLKEI